MEEKGNLSYIQELNAKPQGLISGNGGCVKGQPQQTENSKLWEAFKQASDQNHQQSKQSSQGTYTYYPPFYPSPCPSCGRCPTCGRGGWNQPYITYTSAGTTYTPIGTYTN